MSFWSGLARGFKDSSEKKERDEAVARQDKRLEIEDARYRSEQERADRYRSEDVAYRAETLRMQRDAAAHSRRMAEVQEERLTKAQDFQQGVVWEHTVDMADYSKSRDVVTDLRADRAEVFKEAQFQFQKDRAVVGDEQALREFDLRLEQFEEQQRATGVSEANWNRSFEASQENIDREWLNKVEMQDYSKSRDVVADLRADAQAAAQAARDLFEREKFEVGTEQANRMFDLRMQQFDEQLRATGVDEEYRERAFATSNEQWSRGYDLSVRAADRQDAAFQEQVRATGVLEKQREDNTLEETRRWEITNSRADRQEERADRQEKRAEEAASVERYTALISAMPEGLSSSLGGSSSKGSKGGSSVLSSEAMREGAVMYRKEVANLADGVRGSEFFTKLNEDTGAQATMMAFIAAQAKEGNIVSLEELPKYFKYAGSIEGRGEAAALETLEMLSSGESISDPKAFARGLVAFSQYRPTQHLFQQVNTPVDLGDLGKQYEFWKSAISIDAMREMDKLPDGIKTSVQRALAQLDNPVTEQRGLTTLAQLGFGRRDAEQNNLMRNSVINSFYMEAPQTPEETQEPTLEDTQAPTLEEVQQPTLEDTQTSSALGDTQQPAPEATQEPTDAVTPPPEAVTFSSYAEATEARNEGFTGVGVVNGRVFEVPPLSEAERVQLNPQRIEPGTLAETVSAVEADLAELGVNMEVESRDDLIRLKRDIVEMQNEAGLDIPDGILAGIIRNAMARVPN